MREIIERRRKPHIVEFGTRRAIPQLRLVTQREKRLPASGSRACPRNVDGRFRCQVAPLPAPRWMRERAVVADVPEQLGERNEYLAGIGDDLSMARIALRRRRRKERSEVARLACGTHPVRLGHIAIEPCLADFVEQSAPHEPIPALTIGPASRRAVH